MSHWVKTIDLSDLNGVFEGTPENLHRVGAELIRRLQPEGAPLTFVIKGKALIDSDITVAQIVMEHGFQEIKEWADKNRVWLGGPKSLAEALLEAMKQSDAPEEMIEALKKKLEPVEKKKGLH